MCKEIENLSMVREILRVLLKKEKKEKRKKRKSGWEYDQESEIRPSKNGKNVREIESNSTI